MRTALWVIVSGIVGGFLGYLAGVYVACFVLWPESNVCGLAGVFVTGPGGVLAGIAVGVFLARRPRG